MDDSEVRKAALGSVLITHDTIPFVLERAKDVDAKVRKHVFGRLLRDIELRSLTIEQRLQLLEQGLQDRYATSSFISTILQQRKRCIEMML